MGVKSCTSSLLLGTASSIFLILGVACIASFVAALVTFVSTLVPGWIAGVGIGVGVFLCFIAITGYVGACSKNKHKWPLTVFMLFDLVVFLVVAVVAFFMLRSGDAIRVLNASGFVNVTDTVDHGLSTVVKNGVTSAYDACQADVANTGMKANGDKLFLLSCNRTEWNTLADIVNGNCMGPTPVVQFGNPNATSIEPCFSDQSFWTSQENGYLGPVAWQYINTIVDTPKGVFCQCSGHFSSLFEQYFSVIAWSCIGTAVFFGLTFIACCYLCCCVKVKDDEGAALTYGAPPKGQQGAYIARP